MKNIQPASLSPMHGRYHRKKTQAVKPRPAGEQKIPSQNANRFAYIKKKLYLCRRNCKMGVLSSLEEALLKRLQGRR